MQLTKSDKVGSYLRNKILGGYWKADTRLSESQLMDELGVSQTTLRIGLKVLADEGLVRRAQRSGTYVRDFRKVGRIVILGNMDPLVTPVCHGYRRLIEASKEFIEDSNYKSVLMMGYGRTVDDLMDSLNIAEGNPFKNILGVLAAESNYQLNKFFIDHDIKAVQIGTTLFPGVKNIIHYNTERAVQLMVEHLLSLGHEEFAFMYVGDRYEEENGRRREYMRNLLESCGAKVPRDWFKEVKWSWDRHYAYQTMKELMFLPRPPKLVFFHEDCICDVAMRALIDMKVKIPEDVSIATQANTSTRFLVPYDLTSVMFDSDTIAAQSWKMLQSLVERKPVLENVVEVYPTLHKGQSVVAK